MPAIATSERTLFESLQLRSICALPLRRGVHAKGFIGFGRVNIKGDWSTTVIDLLNVLADLIGSALERASGERKLRQQQRFTQDVLDSASANMAVLDRQGVIVAVNEPWRRYGAENGARQGSVDHDGHIGINYLEVCRPSGAVSGDYGGDDVARGIEAVIAGKTDRFRLEYPCHSPTQPRWFEMTVRPLTGENGGVVVSHTNIT